MWTSVGKTELFDTSRQRVVPDSPIVAAQEMQLLIDEAEDPRAAAELGRQALRVLGEVPDIRGERHLYIHTLGALILGQEDESGISWRFNELYLRGRFEGINYMQSRSERPELRSLVVSMWDVHLLRPLQGDIGNSQLVVPVGEIQSVLLAA